MMMRGSYSYVPLRWIETSCRACSVSDGCLVCWGRRACMSCVVVVARQLPLLRRIETSDRVYFVYFDV